MNKVSHLREMYKWKVKKIQLTTAEMHLSCLSQRQTSGWFWTKILAFFVIFLFYGDAKLLWLKTRRQPGGGAKFP